VYSDHTPAGKLHLYGSFAPFTTTGGDQDIVPPIKELVVDVECFLYQADQATIAVDR
jgi:hypothetical protein